MPFLRGGPGVSPFLNPAFCALMHIFNKFVLEIESHVMNLTNKVKCRYIKTSVRKNCQIYNMRFDLEQKITQGLQKTLTKILLFTFQQYISSCDNLYLWGSAMMSRLNCPETLPRCPARGFRENGLNDRKIQPSFLHFTSLEGVSGGIPGSSPVSVTLLLGHIH